MTELFFLFIRTFSSFIAGFLLHRFLLISFYPFSFEFQLCFLVMIRINMYFMYVFPLFIMPQVILNVICFEDYQFAD